MGMGEKREKYSREFKLEAVRMFEESGRSGSDIERELGIGKSAIYRWRKELMEPEKTAFPGNGSPRDEELAKLKKENAILREEREILRKALRTQWPSSQNKTDEVSTHHHLRGIPQRGDDGQDVECIPQWILRVDKMGNK